MYEQIIELGLIKLAIISVAGFLWGIYKAAKQPVHNGWSTVVQEPAHHRAWKRLTGRRGSTSVEERQERIRIE